MDLSNSKIESSNIEPIIKNTLVTNTNYKISKDYSIMINGSCLALILEDYELKILAKNLFNKASSIIAYRSSPNDKAEIVKMVMEDP